MKLKELVTVDNILKKFIGLIEKTDFNQYRINKKELYYGDCNKDFCIYCNETINDKKLKTVIKLYVTKYWKNFEAQIDFHKYDGDYFIEVRQNTNDKNIWEFVLEATDDTLYLKFDTNFIEKM